MTKRDIARNRTLEGRFRILKFSARRRLQVFDLTFEEYRQLIENSLCFYCGGSLPEAGGGLDRKDHSQGYIKENLVPCCTLCNRKKGRLESLGFSPSRVIELMAELCSKIPTHFKFRASSV